MTVAFVIGGTLFGSALLWVSCGRLEEATDRLARYHGIPDAVKGSVLLAVASTAASIFSR